MKKILLFTLCFFFGFTMLSAQVVVLDFETAATSTTFQYFSSSLEPTLTEVIANPDPTGINTSAMVSNFKKTVDGALWAGAFSNPNPSIPINLGTATEICMKVWFSNPGAVALKLEAGGNPPNWILAQDVTETATWTEICFDISANSIEAPATPAVGNIYTTLTLFFDWQIAETVDQTFYFDDVVIIGGSSDPVDVTLAVDMNNYAGSFTTVYMSGTFNDWSADSNPMSDDDGDGVWTGTINVAPGTYEYKFQLDQWAAQEEFNGTELCTITDPSGQFTNRKLAVATEQVLPPVCFNSCYACGEAVSITINLGQGAFPPAEDGFFIAGGSNFGIPGDFPLTDGNGDGVWTLTIERPLGFSSDFTFTNGACIDWGCKEIIAGQDCAVPPYNDRHMGPIMQDTIISTCFASCTSSTDCSDPNAGTITFEVNMNNYPTAFTTVFISGTFNGWSGDANALTDADADGIWTIDLPLGSGGHQYKFQVDGWTDQEFFTEGDPCTVTDGGFTNRFIEVAGDATVCFFWGTCDACTVGTNDLEVDNTLFSVQPTVVQNETKLVFGESFTAVKTVSIFNAIGQAVETLDIASGVNHYTLDVNNLEDGLYFINVQTEGKQQTQRIIVNRR